MAFFAGRVFKREEDGAIGNPVAGAEIAFRGPRGRANAQTEPNGSYRVELSPGTYQAIVSADGFKNERTRAILRREFQTLNFFLQVQVERSPTGIHGRVFERQEDGTIGDPVAGASVGASRTGSATTTRTDQNGQYSLELAPGRYLVDARSEGFHPNRSRVVVGDGMRVVNLFISAERLAAARTGPPECMFITDDDGIERTSEVLVPGGEIVEMTYRVVDGKAWFEGGIGLGLVEKLDAEVERVRREPGNDEDIPNSESVRTITQALVALGSRDKLWEQGLVPFQIDESNATLRGRISEAIEFIEDNTNIAFLPASDSFEDRIVIRFSRDPDASSADLGRQGGVQEVVLNEDFGTGGIVHELLHSLGVFHEQTRNDRDAFVTVNFDGIEPGREGNFRKAVFRGGVDIGPYDFKSVMHYRARAFGRDANCEVAFVGGVDSSTRYDLTSYSGVEDLGDGWLQVTVPMSDFGANIASNNGFQIRFPGEQDQSFSFLLTDIGFTTSSGGVVIPPNNFVFATDPSVMEGLAPPTITDSGSGSTFDFNFTDDGSFSPALEVTSGEGFGSGRHVALVEFNGYAAGFAQSFQNLVFKAKIDLTNIKSNLNVVTIQPVNPAIPLADLGSARDNPPYMSPGDIAGLNELYPARIGFDGGHLWGDDNYATGITMGDIDGDGRDELVVTRKAPANGRYFVLNDAAQDFQTLVRGGSDWGGGNYATSCAIGDVDGDGIGEVIIGRKADTNHRFRIVKIQSSPWRETELFKGGENWGGGNYVTDVAIAVDGSGTPLIGVARKAGEDARFMIYAGSGAGFQLLFSGGIDWGSSSYATGIAFGDVDGDGRLEVGVTRKAGQNARWMIYKDLAGDYTDFRVVHSGGVDWGDSNYATAVAFGDVDGDGRDEIAVARKAPENGRFFVFDDFNSQFRLLKSGGDRWGSDAYATAVALGDVDGDGRAELAVCRKAGVNARVFLFDDEIGNYRPLWDNGRRWGSSNYATCVALGNGLGAGRARHIAVGRKADVNHRFSVTDYNP